MTVISTCYRVVMTVPTVRAATPSDAPALAERIARERQRHGLRKRQLHDHALTVPDGVDPQEWASCVWCAREIVGHFGWRAEHHGYELGHPDGAVGVDLADPLQADLGSVARRGVRRAQRRGSGSSVHGVASLGALSAASDPGAPVLAADEAHSKASGSWGRATTKPCT